MAQRVMKPAVVLRNSGRSGKAAHVDAQPASTKPGGAPPTKEIITMNSTINPQLGRPGSRRNALIATLLAGGLLAAGCADRERVTRQNTAEDTQTTYSATATEYPSTSGMTATSSGTTAASSGTTGSEPVYSGAATAQTQSDEATMVLDEEKLNVEKRTVDRGGVLIEKKVETEQVSQPVELKRETVDVERLTPEEARQRGITAGEQTQRIDEDQVYIPLQREEAVVQKEVQPREVIRAETVTETERDQVDATVRREVADIERTQPGQSSGREQASSQQQEASMASGQQQSSQGSQLEQRIRTELRTADDLNLQEQDLDKIQIKAEQGKVTLSGSVPSEELANKIVEHVRELEEVQTVDNQLSASR
jgi:stress response protein YsnF